MPKQDLSFSINKVRSVPNLRYALVLDELSKVDNTPRKSTTVSLEVILKILGWRPSIESRGQAKIDVCQI